MAEIRPVTAKSEPTLDWDMLQNLLCCPSCGAEELRFEATKITCSGCSHAYPVEGRIIDFTEKTSRIEPAFYQNRLYRAFIDRLEAIHQSHYGNRFSGGIESRMKQDMLRLVTPGAGPSIDLGCGSGDGLEFILTDEGTIGVDVQMSLLRKAAHRFPNLAFICTDLANLPFRTNALNRVFSNAVLEHVFHLERTMEHIQRCLAPEGRLFVGVPTEGSLAVTVARYFTSQRNAKLIGLTPAQSRDAQRMDHCNTIHLIDNVLRKYFATEESSLWPFQFAPEQFNLFKSYRLRHLKTEVREDAEGPKGRNT